MAVKIYTLSEILSALPMRPNNRMDENLIALCQEWIDLHLKPTKTIRAISSYQYKHAVENWTGETDPRPWVQVAKDVPWTKKGERVYIPEEAFVEAMNRSGYRIKHPNNPPIDMTIDAKFNATRKNRSRGHNL